MGEWTKEEIKGLRETHSLMQRELADLLGVTRQYIVYLEKGVKKPSKTLKLLLDCVERQVKENEKGKEKGRGERDIPTR